MARTTTNARTKKRVQDEYEDRKEQIIAGYEDAKRKVREYGDAIDDHIAKHPKQDTLIAFGAGALIGAALIAAIMGRNR